MGAHEHRQAAGTRGPLRVGVITVSDSRHPGTDEGGALVAGLCEGAGVEVVERALVRDEPDRIRAAVQAFVAGERVDAVLLTGGTGIAPRDGTVEAIESLLDKRLPGYGELFRALSFAEIGAAAMLSRATGGSIGQVAVFLMPGSPAGVKLAMSRLILPELAHVVGELHKHERHVLPESPEPGYPHGDGHGQDGPPLRAGHGAGKLP